MSIPLLNLFRNRFTSCITVYALVLTCSAVFMLTGPAVAQQKIDEEYTAMIKEFTIEPFTSEWVNYLPYSENVPTPLDVLGHIAGAADVLSYTHEIYGYMREVAKASDRVEVFNIGYTEEGREMILVVVSNEDHIRDLDKYKEITGKLADPRTITDAEAEELIEEGLPFYRLTGGLHSGETGSPEMLMELVYRLAVDESEFIREIRENSIVLITPVIEPDGRDKLVDVRMAPRKDPNAPQQSFLYWGAYVAHDNNRDGMSLTLKLYQNLVAAHLEYHPQVVHDLHESASHLYTSTGTGPYNPWFDPIVINEWQTLAYQEITELTKQGIPGVWTHGFYDGWTPNYTFMIGNLHNAIGRFYEVQGAGDASTRRISTSQQRAWYRPNPPLASTMWSMRSNNNLSQSGVLVAINYVANNKETFLENFYIKSKRSVAKATTEGPAAYVLPADDPRPEQQARLLKLFRMQGAEVHKTNGSFTVEGQTFGAGSYVLRLDQPYSRIIDMFLDKQYYNPNDPRPYDDIGWTLGPLYDAKTVRIEDAGILSVPMTKVEGDIVPEGGVRVLTGGEDDVRFGYRYTRSFNTTGPLTTSDDRPNNAEFKAYLTNNFVGSITTADGKTYDVVAKQINRNAASNAYLINYKANSKLTTFRFKNTSLKIHAAEESFTVAGEEFKPGTFILRSSENPSNLEQVLDEAGKEYGFIAWGVSSVPDIPTHEIEVPRVAVIHGWQSNSLQPEGWMRLALDEFEIPFDYVPIQDLRTNTNLRGSYDVIMVGYLGLNAMLNGVGGDNPRPYLKTDLTPNLGRQASTDDIRGGIEMEGVINLKNFVESGGLFITITNSTELPVHFFFAQGLTQKETPGLWARGGVYRTNLMDKNSPIAYGFGDELGVYFNGSPVFNGGARPVGGTVETTARPSGRGDLNDEDIIQGRPKDLGKRPPGTGRGGRGGGRGGRGFGAQQEPQQQPEAGGGRGGRGGGRGRGRGRSGPPEYRTIFQYTPNTQELLISGGIRAGELMAGTPALVDAKMGDGHTLMFSFNPFRRSQTQGSYTLIFNAFLHYNDLDTGK